MSDLLPAGGAVSLHEQALEVELHYLGLHDLLERARSGKAKKAPETVQRMEERLAAAQAASLTLRTAAQLAAQMEGAPAGSLQPGHRAVAAETGS